MVIGSVRNDAIRYAISLRDTKVRAQTGTFGLEGDREILQALAAGYLPVTAWIDENGADPIPNHPCAKYRVKTRVFESIVLRKGSSRSWVEFRQKDHANTPFSDRPEPSLFVALDGIEKPGNIGAILRTADAFGVNGVLLVADQIRTASAASIYSPNTLRASVGTALTVPIRVAPFEELATWCVSAPTRLVLLDPAASATMPSLAPAPLRTLLVLGEEARGIRHPWEQISSQILRVRIPMLGRADSLNVSAAGAAAMFHFRWGRGAPSH